MSTIFPIASEHKNLAGPKTVAEVMAFCEKLWPTALAEPWDNPGLVCGHPEAPVSRLLLAVDATIAVAEEAVAHNADLLLTHHPLLFRPTSTLRSDRPVGATISRLLLGGCALLGVHTNADAASGGVADTLGAALGLQQLRPLVRAEAEAVADEAEPEPGLGRVGFLEEPETLGELAQKIRDIFPRLEAPVRVAGSADLPVRRVALCPGAGDSLLGLAELQDVDVYITGDLRHHPASGFLENMLLAGTQTGLIDISHWAAESLWLQPAATALAAAFPEIKVGISRISTDPWSFYL